jgi:hypothetical protein
MNEWMNDVVYVIMWKNTVETEGLQVTICPMPIACWITKATNTLRICNTHWSSIETMVARTPLNVTLYVLVAFYSQWPLTHFLTLCVSYFSMNFSFSLFMFTILLSQPRQVFLSFPPSPQPPSVDFSSVTWIHEVCFALRLPTSLFLYVLHV